MRQEAWNFHYDQLDDVQSKRNSGMRTREKLTRDSNCSQMSINNIRITMGVSNIH